MLKKSIFPVIAVSVLVFGLLFSFCGKKEVKKVSILYPNWAEGIAFTNLAKVMLEEKGYQVEITPLEPGPIYTALAKGHKDLFMDAWLPNTHKEYWEKYGDKMDRLGESFSGGTTGLVVPKYVEINSIDQLNEQKEAFQGKIIGIGSGAGIHKNTEKAIEAYGLEYEQITSSGPAMLASLKKAVQAKEPVVVTGWKPHIMWSKFDIKYLEDPKNIYPRDVCAILSRKGFSKEFPELGAFFRKFNLSEEQLYSLENMIDSSKDELVGAEKWYRQNKQDVDVWWR